MSHTKITITPDSITITKPKFTPAVKSFLREYVATDPSRGELLKKHLIESKTLTEKQATEATTVNGEKGEITAFLEYFLGKLSIEESSKVVMSLSNPKPFLDKDTIELCQSKGDEARAAKNTLKEKKPCSGTKKDGAPCGNLASKGTGHCHLHGK